MARHVNTDFAHRLCDEGIEFPWLDSGALRFQAVTDEMIHERFGYHRAGRVVDANEENFGLTHGVGLLDWAELRAELACDLVFDLVADVARLFEPFFQVPSKVEGSAKPQ